MLEKIKEKIFKDYTSTLILFAIVIIIVPIQQYFKGSYNNFIIFQHSSFHFFQNINLYLKYPKEYFDVYLYNPTFPILFTPIAYLPTLVGMFLWVILNITLFYFAVRKLPLDKKSILFIFYFTFLELITSVQNLQSNLIIVSGILFAFIFLEIKKEFKSSFFVNLGFFIKAYGAISGALFFLKKPNIKSFLYLLFWFLILASLPLLFYSPPGFILLYKQWINCLFKDHDFDLGLSVMNFMVKVFHYNGPAYLTQLVGLSMMLGTMILIAVKKNYDDVKFFFLAYIMIFVIIFNHASESATYIVASTGVAIWYVNSKKTVLDKILLILTFLLTVLSPSDLFPSYLRKHYVKPYKLKVLGPMLIFIRIQILLIYFYVRPGNNSTTVQSS